MNSTVVIHDVYIGVDESGTYVTAAPKKIEASQGDKFRAQSDKGTFWLKFEPWPFKEPSATDIVDTTNEFTFHKLGRFEFYCYLTPTGSTTQLRYREGDGGNGIVRH